MKNEARIDFRRSVLDAFGADNLQAEELLAYNANVFDHGRVETPLRLPLTSEPHVDVWQRYAARAEDEGAFQVLASTLVQLRFPIAAGISDTAGYAAVVRRGAAPDDIPEATGLGIENPIGFRLVIQQSPGGLVPVLVPATRADFVSLVQALTAKNEPKPVPDSMGATMVGGYINWDRLRERQLRWRFDNPTDDWNTALQQVLPHKDWYQDSFIIASMGPYSAVESEDLGLSVDEWSDVSLKIRINHECTHYSTRRLFASMRNRMLDEIIADYMGIVGALGYYRADWLLRFVGLEDFPVYREGGRLQNYRGDLTDGAFTILQRLVKIAADNLTEFDVTLAARYRSAAGRALVLYALTGLTLEEMASTEALVRLRGTLAGAEAGGTDGSGFDERTLA